MTRPCPQCHNPLTRRDGESRSDFAKRKFCSAPCAHASRVRATPMVKQCALCGKDFAPPSGGRRWDQRRFCGNSCASKAQRRNLDLAKEKLEQIRTQLPNPEAAASDLLRDACLAVYQRQAHARGMASPWEAAVKHCGMGWPASKWEELMSGRRWAA